MTQVTECSGNLLKIDEKAAIRNNSNGHLEASRKSTLAWLCSLPQTYYDRTDKYLDTLLAIQKSSEGIATDLWQKL